MLNERQDVLLSFGQNAYSFNNRGWESADNPGEQRAYAAEEFRDVTLPFIMRNGINVGALSQQNLGALSMTDAIAIKVDYDNNTVDAEYEVINDNNAAEPKSFTTGKLLVLGMGTGKSS